MPHHCISAAAIDRSTTCSISSKDKLLDRSARLNDAIVESSNVKLSKNKNSPHSFLSLVGSPGLFRVKRHRQRFWWQPSLFNFGRTALVALVTDAKVDLVEHIKSRVDHIKSQ